MQIDLKSMTRKELEKHLKDVKKALLSAQARDRREAQKAAEKAAAEFGFSLSDLSDGEKPARKSMKKWPKKPVKKSKPQFSNPSDPSQTWTGKGRQPNWYRTAVSEGTNPDDMRI
ncbi:Histone-like nucleoid-structuring protein H-NS [Sulfitobacter noctilucicola]|uniref:DNA-binding protein H-NS n=1 Tax=Sulfitobacter noctilucicola TaxID=1342301 RepID=A0A7W6MAT0_9RHOB|nr:H-NS histone family protein [Sulfitobacter noctilucicola]KIN63693.1 Histone-like nucleoid-structuring protein H-NS [Sulfitobacter noctilucicola]MBB4174797.1 DNA-binding protein H-NS [Sulfitobacter noctilucicola]